MCVCVCVCVCGFRVKRLRGHDSQLAYVRSTLVELILIRVSLARKNHACKLISLFSMLKLLYVANYLSYSFNITMLR